MTDTLQSILQQSGMKPSAFGPNSRYLGTDTATMEGPGGDTIVYIRRRFIPPVNRFTVIREYTVVQGDRIDNLSYRYIGDPEQFWRLCDANGAFRPDELTEVPGSIVRIGLSTDLQTY